MVWLYVKFWSLLIVFFGILYDKEDHSSEIAEEILNTSLCTHAFLAIPIFGGFLQKIVSLVFIFIGLIQVGFEPKMNPKPITNPKSTYN